MTTTVLIRVPLGELRATPGVKAEVPISELLSALERHGRCDWGDLSAHDKRANDEGVANGDRLLSSYKSTAGVKFWIITEADRSSTTALLPDEY